MPTANFTWIRVPSWNSAPNESLLASTLLEAISPLESEFSTEDAAILARELISGSGWATRSQTLAAAAVRTIEALGGHTTAETKEISWG